ncbi:hypothetical protein [Pseudoalteromonas spongiae]|uniref:hypothetical protein n=1 Tax=Pseudoalteromonas spongiae TaxID=298657 RepID=UPI000C2D5947|nr:hypothetical protein [Pseudoalteromonas spongiae]
MLLIRFITLLSLLFIYSVNAAELVFPEGSEVKVVAEDIFMNGSQVSIWQVETPLKRSEHAEFYANAWQGDGKKFGVKELESEVVVSKFFDGKLFTAQVTQHYPKSIAVVSVSHSPSNKLARIVSKISDLPKPSGSKVLNEIKAKDGAKYSVTLLLSNRKSISNNVSFYTRYLEQQGFTIDRAKTHHKQKEGVILARRGPSEFNATFHIENNQTFITAIRVDADI